MSTGSGTGTPISSDESAYATLAELRRSPDLQLKVGETADDTLLQELLDQVRALIDSETGRVFALYADNTRHFDAIRDIEGLTLHLKDDLCQITTITNGDGDEIEAGEYVTYPRDTTPWYAIKIKSSSGKGWTYDGDPEDAITITGRHAYSITPPPDIKRANILGATALYKQSLSNDSDRAIVTSSGTVIEPSKLPATFWNIIRNYKRKV